jgi:hypothetical protein
MKEKIKEVWLSTKRIIEPNEKVISILSQIALGIIGIIITICAVNISKQQTRIMERQNAFSESLLKLQVPAFYEMKNPLIKVKEFPNRYEPSKYYHYLFKNLGGSSFYVSGHIYEIIHLTLGRLGAQDRHYLFLLSQPWRYQSAIGCNNIQYINHIEEYRDEYDSIAYIYQTADPIKILHDRAFDYITNGGGPWLPEFEEYGKYLHLEYSDIGDRKYQRVFSLLPPYEIINTQQLDSLLSKANGQNGRPIYLELKKEDSLMILKPFLDLIAREGNNYSIKGEWFGPR